MTLPPNFVRDLQVDIEDPYPPHCGRCAHHTQESGKIGLLCWKYGAKVLWESSCKSFEERLDYGATEEQIKEKFPFGLNDLTK